MRLRAKEHGGWSGYNALTYFWGSIHPLLGAQLLLWTSALTFVSMTGPCQSLSLEPEPHRWMAALWHLGEPNTWGGAAGTCHLPHLQSLAQPCLGRHAPPPFSDPLTSPHDKAYACSLQRKNKGKQNQENKIHLYSLHTEISYLYTNMEL